MARRRRFKKKFKILGPKTLLTVCVIALGIRMAPEGMISNATSKLFSAREQSQFSVKTSVSEDVLEMMKIKNSINCRNYTYVEHSDKIADAIYNASTKHEVEPYLITSIVKTESSFNPLAISEDEAKGLMQLMDGTATEQGVLDSFDIVQNINGGTKYFKKQLVQFNGDVTLALAAYNAGPNAVIKYNGIPPFKETQDFVKKVLKYYAEYKSHSDCSVCRDY